MKVISDKQSIKGTSGLTLKSRSTYKQPIFGIFERNGRVYTEIVLVLQKAAPTAALHPLGHVRSIRSTNIL